MPPLSMKEFLGKSNLRLLSVATDAYVPGVVLGSKKMELLVYLADWLEGQGVKWPVAMQQATLPSQVTWEKNLEGKASLDIPGIITIEAGLNPAKKGTFSISGVAARGLDGSQYMQLPVRERIDTWRSASPTNQSRFKTINDHLFLETAWYCAQYTLTFQTAPGASLKVATAGKITVGGGGSWQWTSNRTITVVGNINVPFAVGIWKV